MSPAAIRTVGEPGLALSGSIASGIVNWYINGYINGYINWYSMAARPLVAHHLAAADLGTGRS